MIISDRWKATFTSKKQIIFLFVSLIALFVSFFLNNFMSTYADSVSGAPIGDFFLDLIPIQQVNFIFFWIAFFWCLAMFVYHLIIPRQLTFLLLSFALFVSVRALFITLTHLGPPANVAVIPSQLRFYAFESDLFFSGHVGGPLFFALLTDNKIFKRVALIYTLFMIVIVLIGHMHYSIDIFASLFIAHSLSVIVKIFHQKFSTLNKK